MPASLSEALDTLRSHEAELRGLGVSHASIFGSVARGEAAGSSDIDVLVELDPGFSLGLYEYSRLKLRIAEMFGGSADVVNRKTLKPLLKQAILDGAVNAF